MQADLRELAGTEFPPTAWRRVDQTMVDQFAAVTGDRQWIHVDRARARSGPFGATVAHGFLTLALLPLFWREAVQFSGAHAAVNYGLNRVRFPAPLLVPSRVRARLRVGEIHETAQAVNVQLHAEIEREGGDRPVCVAEALFRYYE